MTAEHDRFAFDDGAYLLGALEPADRAAYERHLAGCATCQASLAELTDLPSVLAQVDPELLSDEASEPLPPTLLPRLLDEVDRRRTRRVLRAATAGFLAACLIVALALGGVHVWSAAHRPASLALQAVGPNPTGVHASVRLVGDRIKLDCGYPGRAVGGYAYPAPSYRMLVVNRAGATRDLGSWTPQPGEDVQLTRTNPWPRSALAGVEIADQQGTVVLRLAL